MIERAWIDVVNTMLHRGLEASPRMSFISDMNQAGVPAGDREAMFSST
jgi:hypothetical protein